MTETVPTPPTVKAAELIKIQSALDDTAKKAEALPAVKARAVMAAADNGARTAIKDLIKSDAAVLGWRLREEGLSVVTADGRKALYRVVAS